MQKGKSTNQKSERGQAPSTGPSTSSGQASGQAYIEFIIVLPIFLIIIAGVIGFGRIMYAKLATQAAAWSACRHAIATLDEERGTLQAMVAARYTLDGFSLDANAASVQVTHWGAWQRGTQVRVRVCYGVPPALIPMGDAVIPQLICSQQLMPVYQLKSYW